MTFLLYPTLVIVVIALLLYLGYKRFWKALGIVLGVLLVIGFVGSPVRFTSPSLQYNEIQSNYERHQELPPRIVVEKETFEEKLQKRDRINKQRLGEIHEEITSDPESGLGVSDSGL